MTSLDWCCYFTAEVPDEALQARRCAPRLGDPFARFPTRRYWLRRMNRPVSRPLNPVAAGPNGVSQPFWQLARKRLTNSA